MSEKTSSPADKKSETKTENSVSPPQKSDSLQLIDSPVEQILFLQRTLGNQAVGRLIRSGALQTKLVASLSADPYEQDADHAAKRMTTMSTLEASPVAQRQKILDEEKEKEKTTFASSPVAHSSPIAQSNSALPTDGSTPSTISTSSPESSGPSQPKPEAVPSSASTTVKVDEKTAPQGAKTSKPAGKSAEGPGPASKLQLDTSSTEGLLQSVANAPASMFGQSVSKARAASLQIQSQEKAALSASFPEVDQPTGLPVMRGPKKIRSTALTKGNPPEPEKGGGGPPARESDVTHTVASGPLPASGVSIAASEPAAQESGSWWDWLFGRVRNFIGSLPTSDPGVSTSAGPTPQINLTGDADPARNAAFARASENEVTSRRIEADAATTIDFGEQDIYPTVTTKTLRPAYKPSAPGGTPAGIIMNPPTLPTDVRAEFDQDASPLLRVKVQEQIEKHRKDQETYKKQSKESREEGEKKIADATAQVQAEQKGLQAHAQSEVNAGRKQWLEENRKIQETFATRSTARRVEIDQQIHEKIQTTKSQANIELTKAETKAEQEKKSAEAQATAKRQEEENKPKSWWESVKGAISDAFAAIKKAVNDIFDALRKKVKEIIETAKKVVRGLIDAARDAIVGFIKVFGEVVKGLVTIALAAFPEAATKARAWIDTKVYAATNAVNKAAEVLKKTTDAILDTVGIALDAALSLMQKGFNAALDVLEFLAKLPFDALEALEKLVAWVAKNGKFVTAALDLEGKGDSIIEALKNAIGGMIAEVPGKAYAKLQEFAGQLGGEFNAAPAAATVIQRKPDDTMAATSAKRHVSASEHIKGILRHLDKGLEHLKNHWWEELKKVGWNLLWPWPAVWSDLKDIWKEIKAGFEDVYHLRIGKVIDHLLAADQKFNSILGNLYGWFFIASVLIGTIIGAFFGGAGAIPGALVGAAFAGEVGEALVAMMIATETAVIVKSVADLAIGNDRPEEDEEDYGKIGGSTLTIAITLALLLLGEIAAKLAKSIWDGVVGLFKGEKAPEVSVRAEGEAPEVKSEAPEVVDGERVVGKEPTADGHEIKITEEGRCLICSTCEEIQIKYKEELKGESPEIDRIKSELEEARKMPNGDEKAEAIEKIKEKLDKVREEVRKAETPKIKSEELKKIKAESRGAIERIKENLKKLGDEIKKAKAENKAMEAKVMEKTKAEIEEELRGIEDEWTRASEGSKDIEKDIDNPDLLDLAREEFDDVRTKAEQLEGKVQDSLPKVAEEPAYVRENRPALDKETLLGNENQFTRIGRKFQGREIYVDAEGKQYYVDNFHNGKASEIEVFNAQGEHLGTINPDGSPKGGPTPGRRLRD